MKVKLTTFRKSEAYTEACKERCKKLTDSLSILDSTLSPPQHLFVHSTNEALIKTDIFKDYAKYRREFMKENDKVLKVLEKGRQPEPQIVAISAASLIMYNASAQILFGNPKVKSLKLIREQERGMLPDKFDKVLEALTKTMNFPKEFVVPGFDVKKLK